MFFIPTVNHPITICEYGRFSTKIGWDFFRPTIARKNGHPPLRQGMLWRPLHLLYVRLEVLLEKSSMMPTSDGSQPIISTSGSRLVDNMHTYVHGNSCDWKSSWSCMSLQKIHRTGVGIGYFAMYRLHQVHWTVTSWTSYLLNGSCAHPLLKT